MNSLIKCYEADDQITLVFENELSIENTTVSNFTISSGDITSFEVSRNTVVMDRENVTQRPVILSCNVTNIDNSTSNFSRILAREFNYKKFNLHSDLCDYFLNNPSTDLDALFYYDAVDCRIYHDNLGQQFASDLNGLFLVYSPDFNDFYESVNLSNGNCPGWQPPQC